MPSTPRPYTFLARSLLSGIARHSLWLASDHILQVANYGVSESYQRFHFRDLKGVLISPSRRFTIINAISGSLTGLSGLVLALSLAVWGWSPFAVFLLIVLIPSAVALVTNFALGPTCQVHVVTGVQIERLRALSRRGRARRILARIEPLIAAAQTALVPPPLAPTAAPAAPAETPVPPAAAPAVEPLPPPPAGDTAPAPNPDGASGPPPASTS